MRVGRRWPFILLVAVASCVVLVFANGCLRPEPNRGGMGPAPAYKIVSLSPSTSSILELYMLGSRVVGRTKADDDLNDIKGAPVVVEGTKPNFEKIARLKPDVVVYDAKLYMNTDLVKLESLGARVYKMDVDTVEALMDFMLRLGGDLGAPSRASQLVDELHDSVQRATANAPDPPVRVAVLAGGSGEYLGGGQDSFIADVVKKSGGSLVGPPGKVFATVSIEAIVKGDPELILTTEGSGHQILADRRLASVAAFKHRPPEVFEVPPAYLYQPGAKTVALIDNLSNKITLVASKRRGT